MQFRIKNSCFTKGSLLETIFLCLTISWCCLLGQPYPYGFYQCGEVKGGKSLRNKIIMHNVIYADKLKEKKIKLKPRASLVWRQFEEAAGLLVSSSPRL